MVLKLGYISLIFCFFFNVFGSIIALLESRFRFQFTSKIFAYLSFVFTLLAVLCLEFLLINSDFSSKHVFENTTRELPLFYKISALWGGQDGSILFWLIIQNIFTMSIFLSKRAKTEAKPYLYSSLLFIQAFFSFVLILFKNPFEEIFPTPANGVGLNPLLQNPGMVIHPPLLYAGFVGSSVPFALALSYSVIKDDSWIFPVRRWMLSTWLFLTLGNILGGWWAYNELGWGGYWAWDPVENSSFIPWLLLTALLHSIHIQEKRGIFKLWNASLAVSSFLLSIFGTFLTRSGILVSVHAFVSSPQLGTSFLVFIFILTAVSVYVLLSRSFKSEWNASVLSKETAYLLNNIIFASLAFVVFFGTTFPIVYEVLTSNKISVGKPFFNFVFTPIGILLVFIMLLGQILSWKETPKKAIIENILFPLPMSLLITILYVFFSKERRTEITVVVFAISLTSVHILWHFYRVGFPIFKSRKKLGGYIVHLGTLFVILGIAFSHSFSKEIEIPLSVGDSFEFSGFNLEYKGISQIERQNWTGIEALFSIEKNGKHFELRPQKRFYHQERGQPTTEAAIYSKIIADLYIVLSEYDETTQRIVAKIWYNPLISFIWIGTAIIFFGSIVTLLKR